MSGLSIYTRRILSGKEFRLLFICPSIDPRQPLECYCCHFEIEAAPPYEALSYVWGTSTASVNIFCNGRSITVTVELANSLTRLRLPNSTRIVWADAICINQKDNREKSNQVPLMGRIYSLARKVVVWFGHGEPRQIREAIRCVEITADACRDFEHRRRTILHYPENFKKYQALNLPVELFTSDVCKGLEEMYDRPWFTRVWCVQEIRLARDAVVLWGDQETLWSNVGLAASWIFDRTTYPSPGDAVAHLLNGVSTENAALLFDVPLADASLLDVLSIYRCFESSEPKDKVYGLLNLITTKSEVEALSVDYEKSVGEVYADTVLSVIRLRSRLTALAFVTHPKEYDGSENTRSWAPHWQETDAAEPMGTPEEICPWRPCLERQIQFIDAEHVGSEQLRLMGITYDSVTMVGNVMDAHNLNASEEWEEAHAFLDVLKHVGSPTIADPGNNLKEQWGMLARTLTVGSIGGGYYVEDLDEEAEFAYYAAFVDFIETLSKGTFQDPASLNSASTRFRNEPYYKCKRRRFFGTQNGTYGIGPQCMRTGDIVAVLYGGNTPYVLRPKGDKYLFMGQAYVDGIMQGQLVQEIEAGRVHEEMYCLI